MVCVESAALYEPLFKNNEDHRMEVEYDKTSDVTEVKLTRGEIRKILCGETVEQYTNVGGVFKIEKIDDADTIIFSQLAQHFYDSGV